MTRARTKAARAERSRKYWADRPEHAAAVKLETGCDQGIDLPPLRKVRGQFRRPRSAFA